MFGASGKQMDHIQLWVGEGSTCKLLKEAGCQRSWFLNTLEDSGSTSEAALNFHTLQLHLFYLLRTRLESLNDLILDRLSTTPQWTCHNKFWDSRSSGTDQLTGSHPVRSRAQVSISLLLPGWMQLLQTFCSLSPEGN